MTCISLRMHIIRQDENTWRGTWKGQSNYVYGTDYMDVYHQLIAQQKRVAAKL